MHLKNLVQDQDTTTYSTNCRIGNVNKFKTTTNILLDNKNDTSSSFSTIVEESSLENGRQDTIAEFPSYQTTQQSSVSSIVNDSTCDADLVETQNQSIITSVTIKTNPFKDIKEPLLSYYECFQPEDENEDEIRQEARKTFIRKEFDRLVQERDDQLYYDLLREQYSNQRKVQDVLKVQLKEAKVTPKAVPTKGKNAWKWCCSFSKKAQNAIRKIINQN